MYLLQLTVSASQYGVILQYFSSLDSCRTKCYQTTTALCEHSKQSFETARLSFNVSSPDTSHPVFIHLFCIFLSPIHLSFSLLLVLIHLILLFSLSLLHIKHLSLPLKHLHSSFFLSHINAIIVFQIYVYV